MLWSRQANTFAPLEVQITFAFALGNMYGDFPKHIFLPRKEHVLYWLLNFLDWAFPVTV